MRGAALFVVGLAAGMLVLAGFLISTGRLNLNRPLPEPNTDVSKLGATKDGPLPAPPNPSTMAPPPAASAVPTDTQLKPGDVAAAPAPRISLPIAGLKRADIHDTFNDTRQGGKHEASDIMAPRGTPVLAVEEGNVVKLFTSKKGGLTVYQFDNSRTYCYYYAHLDKYAEGLKEGMLLRRGDKVGYVGSTGDAAANAPHLHLAILLLGPDKHWWENTTAIDPYPLLVAALGQ